MISTIIRRFLGGLATNEQLINKLAETKPIRRAAQLTAYGITRFLDVAKKQMIEFEKSGGAAKMREVAKKDTEEATKIVKEMITYDLPHLVRNMLRNMSRNMFRK